MDRTRRPPASHDGGRPIRIVAPTPEAIKEAADALRRGELIGMPTETVYGLAAVATNRAAVRKVFDAKGRPAENPLIVHIASLDQVTDLSQSASREAEQLAGAFWPGPLTIVLRKRDVVPDEVTAGKSTVALRMPAHPIARALIQAAGAPLAAPSANRFMSLSPTRPEHISEDVAKHLALILDGGQCEVGVESTVVDCTDRAVILRPGGVSIQQIEGVLGRKVETRQAPGKAPGQYPRHYAPKASIRIAKALSSEESGITFSAPAGPHQIQAPRNPEGYASMLYWALHELDRCQVPEIVIEEPPREPGWEAVWDRLTKASTP